MGNVERRDWLIEQQTLHILRHKHREPHTLMFAARQRVGQPLLQRSSIGQSYGLLDLIKISRSKLSKCSMPWVSTQCHEFFDQHSRRRRHMLRQIGNLACQRTPAPILKGLSLKQQPACGWFDLMGQKFQQGGFPGTVVADQSDRFSLL